MHTKGIRLLFLLVCFGCLFLCSCGLDEYYVIEPPSCSSPVDIESDDTTQMFYKFTCPPVTALTSSQISMKGTSVLYMVYDDKQTCKDDIAIMNSTGANPEYSDTGYNILRDESSSKKLARTPYQPMIFTPTNSTVSSQSSEYIQHSGSSTQWFIRLNPQDDTEENISLILSKSESESLSDDMKITIDKPSAAGEYYINAYALTVGEVPLKTTQRSQLAPLGVLKFTIE